MLHIHRAVRADALADALAALLCVPLDDPFAAEVVAVPTRGMERWLTQRMSSVLGARPGRDDGVCANVLFPFPQRLITDAVATASGIDPADDPWLPERSVWPLMTVVEESLHEPWLAALARYLGAAADPPDPVRQARRLTALRHLAGLFHRYSLHRPQMLAAWREGRDVDSAGAPLSPASAWQAELWRRLRARLGVADLAERAAGARDALIDDPQLLDLPARLSVFGLTRIPAGHLQILRALAAGRDLHLFLLHPSPALWERVGDAVTGVPTPSRAAANGAGPSMVVPRSADPTAALPANRLLASWGRDAREMQLVLLSEPGALADHPEPDPPAPATLLGMIQDDVRADRPPPGPPLPGTADARAVLAGDDRSIEVHSCHGRARQAEVIRDAVLHALTEDPALEPRDVIVMCPDIETFAPLIQATFGAGEAQQSPDDPEVADGDGRPIDLRVRLADRSLRQTNPVLGVVSALLELADERMTASQILDLADRGPVRRRFRLDDEDITRLQDWISQAGIRWGLDAAHRAPYRLQTLDSGTWRVGLDRLLLGVTMTEDGQRLFSGVLPLDDVDSRSIDLAGRFAELVARTGQAVESLSMRQSLSAWAEAIADAADGLAATSPRDRWQRAELQRVLDEMVSEAGGGAPAELAPAEMRAFLAQRLEGRPTRANFRTGHLTVCTLMPMRSVPHRVVCLLGLDDGAFPRKATGDGDDLMLAEPLVGERDPRSEDRQLLLDALMAATDRLIVTYSGNDERTNAPRPPAVPVGELLDTIDATARCDAGPARRQVVIQHPLQPFDPRNFTAGAVAGTPPWSFDSVALAGARALTGPRVALPPLLHAPLPPRTGQVVELADLVRFLEHPVRAFLRQRLGIGLWAGADEIEDALSVELDPLERWGVGQRLLEARLAGVEGRTASLAEIARGTLPPGVLGKPVIDDLYPMVDAIFDEATKLVPAAAGGGLGGDPVDVRVPLADGRLLTGTVSGVSGDVLLVTTFSRVSAKHRIAAWARLLAVTATDPARPFQAATVGRAGGGDDVRVAWIEPLAADPGPRGEIAVAHLDVLVDLYDRGLREPLPLSCLTSEAYAAAARAGQDAVAEATRKWESEWNYDGEDAELEHQMAFGGVLTFDEILELAPRADEDGDGWEGANRPGGDSLKGIARGAIPSGADESRFGRYARRLWDGLLGCEQVMSR
jgi:exodeoxyribonuclease V gamma subunit